jgi:hypothetical protein
MRRLAAALVVAAALVLSAAAVARVGGEPVRLTIHSPNSVRVHDRFGVAVQVAASPGALDIAAKPLRVRVRLARECGATFGTTPGPTVIDQRVPPPQAGARYRAAVKGKVRIGRPGRQTVCAFLVDSEKRQFATSVDKVVRVQRR